MKDKNFTKNSNIAYKIIYFIKKAALSTSKDNQPKLDTKNIPPFPKSIPNFLLPEKALPAEKNKPKDIGRLFRNLFKDFDKEEPALPPIIDPDTGQPLLPKPPAPPSQVPPPQNSAEQPLNKPEFYYEEFLKYLEGKAHNYHKPLIVYEYILKNKDEVRGELGVALRRFFKKRRHDEHMFDFDRFMKDDDYFEETIHKLFRPYLRS